MSVSYVAEEPKPLMEIDQLKELATRIREVSIERLTETGSLDMVFHLVRTDGTFEIVYPEPDAANHSSQKDALSKLIRARIAGGGIEAVIFVSDIYFGKTINNEATRIMQQMKLNVEEGEALGLIKKVEAVMVTIDSPIYFEIGRQVYTRDKQDRSKVTLGEFERTTAENGMRFEGRFFNFFGAQKDANA